MQRVALFLVGWILAGCMIREPDSPPARELYRAAAPATGLATRLGPQSFTACPMVRPMTRVAAEDVSRGAAMVFTASSGIGELRERILEDPPDPLSVSARRRFDDIEDGVRVVFEEPDYGDVEVLRWTVHRRARELVQRCGLVWGEPRETEAPAPGLLDVTAPQQAGDLEGSWF
jgi:hypothetical protein